jgi:signal transduction histidine kinase
MDIEVDAKAAEDLMVTTKATHELLSIAREALSNVARHAEASRVRVKLEVDGSDLRLIVVDNGRGMPPEPVGGPEHLGLSNMSDRARSLGGEMRIERSRPHGTRVIIRAPLVRVQSLVDAEATKEVLAT